MSGSKPDNGARSFTFRTMIDIGVGIISDAPHESWKPKVRYLTHEGEGLDWSKQTYGATEEDLVGGKGAALEDTRKRARFVKPRPAFELDPGWPYATSGPRDGVSREHEVAGVVAVEEALSMSELVGDHILDIVWPRA